MKLMVPGKELSPATFIAVLLLLSLTILSTEAQTRRSKYVYLGADERLVYVPDSAGNVIPDFSNCGYMGGGVKLPDAAGVPVRTTVAPASGDATARIQQAIDTVSLLAPDQKGFRGAVLLKRGQYNLSGSLSIRASGVLLRGEGRGKDGTLLVATGTDKRTLINIGGQGNVVEQAGTRQNIVDNYVPVGAHSFSVADAAGFKVGERVIVYRPSTAGWIHAIGMDALPPPEGGGKVVEWTPGVADMRWERRIVAVGGNKITVDAPLTNALQAEYGGGSLYKYDFPGRIEKIGVEELSAYSAYANSEDEQHAWDFIAIDAAENVWVRAVETHYFAGSAVVVHSGAKWVTVCQSACLDPVSTLKLGRRHSFELSGQMCLVLKCHTAKGRHDCTQGSSVPGPNVFCHVIADDAYSDSGPHERWASGTLYDNVEESGPAAGLNARNRGSKGSGQGWAGAQIVFWNCSAAEMYCEMPPTAVNWAIGCSTIANRGDGYWDSVNEPVAPSSLFLKQLSDRLGSDAVSNVWPD